MNVQIKMPSEVLQEKLFSPARVRGGRRKRTFRKSLRPALLDLARRVYTKADVDLDDFAVRRIVEGILTKIYRTVDDQEFVTREVPPMSNEELIKYFASTLRSETKPFEFAQELKQKSDARKQSRV
jgi:hypothetical protein